MVTLKDSHRKGISNMDETVHLHDISHPLNNVSKSNVQNTDMKMKF